MKKKAVIVGTGAIGSYFGGRLAQAGFEVTTLCRSDFEIVKAQGIEISSYLGDFHFTPHSVIQNPEEYQDEADYVFVCVKALPEISIIEKVKQLVVKKTAIVIIQNGIEIDPPFAKAFPSNEIIGGIGFIGATRLGYGKVKHYIAGGLSLGNYPQGVSEKTSTLIKAFQGAGVEAKETTSIQRARWKKLVWNIGFNPVSVLCKGADTHQLLDNPETLKLIQSLMKEVTQLSTALGFDISPAFAEKQIELTRQMAPYKTSMTMDIEEGRPMELEAIVNNAIKVGTRINMPTPYMKALYGLLVHHQIS
ncbi:MAG: 2-dehydropantoate 2-reductase [SAR324 cluster bacterium]|nr:2-dehydropantoate 2-reductase [SAR324 cluster bacterium]